MTETTATETTVFTGMTAILYLKCKNAVLWMGGKAMFLFRVVVNMVLALISILLLSISAQSVIVRFDIQPAQNVCTLTITRKRSIN